MRPITLATISATLIPLTHPAPTIASNAPPATRPAASATTTAATTTESDRKVPKIKLDEFDKLRSAATDKDKDAVVVLDVRTPKEYAAGHVPGALNIDWRSRDFNEQVAKLDKSKTYLVHCLGGVRSAAATQRMSELGFPHLYDYAGGWMDYRNSGDPVEK